MSSAVVMRTNQNGELRYDVLLFVSLTLLLVFGFTKMSFKQNMPLALEICNIFVCV